jgi:hypothetical protein
MTMAEPNAPQDPFEMYRRLWGPLGVPVPGMAMPTLDPQEVEKRIQELKAVETWLNMNLNMLRLAIQGLEMQKAGLAAMQQAMAAGSAQPDKDRKP